MPLQSSAILVLDDDDSVRAMITGVLKHSGFKVFSAASFTEALEVWGEHREAIGLLISDLVMPDGFGTDFAQVLKERKPSVKILFVSGHFPEELSTTFRFEEGVNFLQKPFSVDALKRFIQGAEPF